MIRKKMVNPNGSIPGYEGSMGGYGAATIPFVGSAIDTFVQSETTKRNVDKTIEAQKREAELAYQRSVEMWHMQNAYNSPAQQMARFGAAGLNPHLMYGQGSAGNASGTPQYSPPDIQYRYAAPTYGAAMSEMLPTLMSVGTWMQNMRLSEVEISKRESESERIEQILEFMSSRNPKELERLDNALSMYPYQRSQQRAAGELGNIRVSQALEEYRHLYGGDLSKSLEFGELRLSDKGSGLRGQQFLKAIADARLRKSQADLFEPATIMRMVLGAVTGMAGLGRAAGVGRVAARSGGRAIKQKFQRGLARDNKGQLFKYSPDGSRKRIR